MIAKEKGGSFRALREHHLPLFDKKVHRHDRGWPHSPAEKCDAPPAKPRWKTVGIFHFRHDGGDN